MIVHLVDPEPAGPHGGGIRTYVRECARLLADNGISVRIYSHNPQAYGGREVISIGRRAFLPWGFRAIAYRWMYHWNILMEHSHWLASVLEKNVARQDVVEIPDFMGYAFFSLFKKSLHPRIVLRIHTPAFLITGRSGERRRPAQRLAAWVESHCLRKAMHLSFPSLDFARECLPGIRRGVYIPNPLSGTIRVKDSHIPEKVPPTLLYLGRLEERKGVHILLDAFTRFAVENPESRLFLAGSVADAGYHSRLRRLSQHLETEEAGRRIVYLAPHSPEELPGLHARASFLVMPSLWENCPYAFLEGLDARLVCISSRTGEMKRVQANVPGALTAAAGSVEQLLDCFRRLPSVRAEYEHLLRAQDRALFEHRARAARMLPAYYREVAR